MGLSCTNSRTCGTYDLQLLGLTNGTDNILGSNRYCMCSGMDDRSLVE
jgi:hypothetical protein